ncbi:MAG TPA: hypothetical protein DCG06_00375 [Deltaproteobacteria bacterium]|nr:hypothetical protein [Deltaproteobacteria bacterium]
MTATIPNSDAGPPSRTHPRDALWLTLGALAVYWATNDGTFMFFNYHLHLAVSFLEGRTWIADPPSWLTEFAWSGGRPYVYFDPFPAIFLIPFAQAGGLAVNLAYVSIGVGAANIGLMRLLLGQLRVARGNANLTCLLFAFGTVHFFAAEFGNTWLLAHLLACAGLTLAFLEATGRANAFLTGVFCAVAATSRSPSLLGAPVFLFLLWQREKSLRTIFEFGLPFALTAALLAAYNIARFGDPLDNGYIVANQALLAPEHGSFSWRYLGQNLRHYFLLLPTVEKTWPYLKLTDHGLSLIATTPALLLLLRRGWSSGAPDAALLGRASMAGAAMIFSMYLLYFWDGWRQFGSRYTLDFTPFLIVALALRNDPRPGLRPWIWPAAIAISCAINIWGIWYWKTFLN